QRAGLGLTVPKQKSPIARPADAPAVHVMETMGRTVKLRITDAEVIVRAKPPGAVTAAVLSFVGEQPSDRNDDWKLEFTTTRRFAEIRFPNSLPPGSRVWIRAYWMNPRQQRGP